MKTVADVRAELDRKLTTHWHTWLAQECDDIPAGTSEGRWPLIIPLGRPDRGGLRESFAEINREAIIWRDLAAEQGLQLRWANRLVNGTTQTLPTHLELPDLDTAACVAGGDWPRRLRRSRRRWDCLQERFGPAATAKELRYTDSLEDLNFEMLVTAALWFRTNDATGMTPRQVPLAGLHGKWLNQHHACLQALSGKTALGLTRRPSRILFSYLDPQHLALGRRRHDSFTLGDTSTPAYQPRTVIICENKDTALLFPEVPEAVSIFGNGDAASRQLPHLPWLAEVPLILYWGDIDTDGFECLNSLRAAGVNAESILMDDQAYASYEPYGSWTDGAGKALTSVARKALQHLSAYEDELYQRLCGPGWQRVRRIEQERIPLKVGQRAVLARLTAGR